MKKSSLLVFVVSLILILLGSALAHYIDTSGGDVSIQDVRFDTSDGKHISALLYRPKTATAENPAPGVLAIHGYINSRETQSGFAIELSRRGFVVLAMDQTGHGYSDPPAFANAFGAPAGLTYLRSLDFVDTSRIGLEGHSMGGWASRAVTQLMPDAYHAIVMEGASTASVGGLGDFTGSPDEPKNIAIVYSLYDEFSTFMWQGKLPTELNTAPPLQQLFGQDRIETGKVYGDVEQGTGRVLYQPATTHPGDHISSAAILNAVSWLQLTLQQESDIAADSSVFIWKEIGTLIALLGLGLCVFPLTAMLLNLPVFQSLQQPLPTNGGEQGINWWLAALLATAISALTYFWLQNTGQSLITPNGFWPQQITNGIVFWALGNGLITLILLSLGYWLLKRRVLNSADYFGFKLAAGSIGKTLVLALFVSGIVYGIASLTAALFTTDFRFWVVALKPLPAGRASSFVFYLPALVLFFFTVSALLNGPLRLNKPNGTEASLGKQLLGNSLILAGGLLVMLIVQYGSLFANHQLVLGEPLLTIVAIQFIPLLTFIACTTTACFRLTGRSYLGSFINGLLITWYIVAGQATHFPG